MMLRRPIAVALAMTPLILSIGCAAGTATREAEPDNPGQAHAWRRLAWKDEQGRIDPDGLIDALWQRRDNIEFWQDRAIHDAAGGIAGVTGPTWNDHGPGNVGGRTRSLVIHPTQTDRMWAGSVGGGLWRTEDGGATWTAVDDWWASLAIGCLAIDPANPDVMYAGTGEGFFNGDAIGGAGIYRSIDGGQTWNRLISTIGWENVCRIAISPDDSDVILAGIRYGGIRRSDDGGVSWSTPRSSSWL